MLHTSTIQSNASLIPHNPLQNCLLATFSEKDYEQLLPNLELVSLPTNSILYGHDCSLSHVYFPTTSIVSLASVFKDGTSVEFALVGNDGVIGTALFMGGEISPSDRAIALNGGYAYRMSGALFASMFDHSITIQHVILRYTQALISQISQTAVCNRHHPLDSQLCRLLLLIHDRLQANRIDTTQELLANTLGVRREGISEAAKKLQETGLINYSRGCISILDRAGLEKLSCECYVINSKRKLGYCVR